MAAGGIYDDMFRHFGRTKRHHRKSRLGCITCKWRRVKCDEGRPSCMTCRKRGTECVYVDQTLPPPSNGIVTRPSSKILRSSTTNHAASGSRRSASSTTKSSIPTPYSGHSDSPLPEQHAPESVNDAELAEHYFEFVAPSFSRSCARGEQHRTWHVWIPSLSYTSETVRLGLLTLGAISLHFQCNDSCGTPLSQDTSRYMEAALARGDVFVKQSRVLLDKLDPNDIDTNAACSRLLAVLALAYFRHHRNQRVSIKDPRLWTWLHLLRGERTVHLSLLASDRALAPVIKQDMMPELFSFALPPTAQLPELTGNTRLILAFIRETQTERLEVLQKAHADGTLSYSDQSGASSKQQSAAIAAINSLARVTEHICAWTNVHSLSRAIMTWPGDLSDDFVQLLVHSDYSALTIYTHWLMLVALAEDLWWVDDMARSGIRAIVDLIPRSHAGLHDLMKRPKDLLHLMEPM